MKGKVYKRLHYLIPPFVTALVLLGVYRSNGLYPFGEGTISWCDMDQQSVPLLMELKDILDGRESIFLNMKNAGGMNFYGVFFFFLSSPVNLLVKLVDKRDMIYFVNILVTIKLSLSALTAYIYFLRCHQKLTKEEGMILSAVYALCGYGMLFYQNPMWLDVMYLFPLLVTALEKLMTGGGNIPYIAVLSAVIFCNYYLSYMAAIYVMLFVGLYVFCGQADKRACVKLISGTLLSLMITAFVWLPSFIQVQSSGRSRPLRESIGDTHFLANYETSIPVILCSGLVFAIVGANLLKNKTQSKRANMSLLMFVAMLIPVFIEPVNLAWHIGNYQAFPARYGFITIFCGLRCCAEYLFEDAERGIRLTKSLIQKALGMLAAVVIVWYYIYRLPIFIEQHFDDLTRYTSSLWGNKESLDRLSELFFFALICYLIIYLLYRGGRIERSYFILCTAVLVLAESAGSVKIYMASPYLKDTNHANGFAAITDLSDKLPDDGLYRVITEGKITDYNMIGAVGYNSLSHYTSLTDLDFMTMQKQLGYTSVWMEVGSHGGTDFTNAIYGARYKIFSGEPSEAAVVSNDTYYIEQLPISLGPAIITDADLSGCEYIPQTKDRAGVQRYIFESLYGDDPITEYYPHERESIIHTPDGLIFIEGGSLLTYEIYVSGDQTLYADCSGNFTNELSEPYFDSLSIIVNGEVLRDLYPTTTDNGLAELGRFKDETVEVEIWCQRGITAGSFGIFGFNNDMLRQKAAETNSVDMLYKRGRLTGHAECGSAMTCLLSVPYSDGFTVRVNGRKVGFSRTFTDMISFPLEAGENDIRITYLPKGFVCGAAISLFGVLCLILYSRTAKKRSVGKKTAAAAETAVKLIVAAAFIVIYIYPMIVNLTYTKE